MLPHSAFTSHLAQLSKPSDPSLSTEAKKQNLVTQFEDKLKKSKSIKQKSRLVYLWVSKGMEAWEQSLEMSLEKAKAIEGGISADLKHERNVFMASRNDLKPLIKQLRKETLTGEVLDHLFVIVNYCLLKEYIRA